MIQTPKKIKILHLVDKNRLQYQFIHQKMDHKIQLLQREP